jgi:transposase
MNIHGLYEGIDSYSEDGKKGMVLVMDNARIHHERNVKEVLNNYNVEYLPAYSPHLNPIELWFGQLRKYTARTYYTNTL